MPASRTDSARAEILEAAAHAIASHGYHGMSMRGLARAAGRSPASFYNHFASKEDVLFELQVSAFETLVETAGEAIACAGPNPRAQLYALVLHHIRYFSQNPDVMRVLIQEASALSPERRQVVRALKERYFEVGRAIVAGVAAADDSGAALDDIELERATYTVFGMMNWVYGWYDQGRHGSPSDVAHTIHRLALAGLGAAGGPHPVSLDGALEAIDAVLAGKTPRPLIDPARGPVLESP